MLGVIGTVPDLSLPLTHGTVALRDDQLRLSGRKIPINRGTPALLAAAIKTLEQISGQEIYAFLVGDIGRGDGSRRLYDFLCRHIAEFEFDVLTFHYLQPDVDWHNKVLFAVQSMKQRPVLIADAGFMYAAKMSGQASSYDFFTPDIGELSFLADEIAPHPFYTRGFILHQHDNAPGLIRRAYEHRNSAACLLVKGPSDYIANESGIVATVNTPSFDAMEAIGGTGDSLTGILTTLSGTDLTPTDAAAMAARTNRWTGFFTPINPSVQIIELIRHIPEALSEVIKQTNAHPA